MFNAQSLPFSSSTTIRNFSLSFFIGSVFNAYVQALNRQQKRKGTIFESRFKHVLINNENYIVHLFCRYIHLNPVNAGLMQEPKDWPFSNYREWINLPAGTLKDEAFIKDQFNQPQEYERFVNDFILEGETSLIKDFILE